MSTADLSDMRFQELAAGFALGDLTEAEMQEIKSIDPSNFQSMAEKSEEAAARAFLTFQGSLGNEILPIGLANRLKSMAVGFLSDSELAYAPKPSAMVAPSAMSLREATAWLCMAASIALALCIWLPNLGPSGKKIAVNIPQQRDLLIAQATDLVQSQWEPASKDDTQRERGSIVWSSVSQQGFMTLRGLAVNDPTKEQYQLWIIDPARDDKPIDGGVFDIDNEKESVVPIQAKLRVGKPTLFAITVEKPGGVVVSDQKRLPLIAKVQ